MYQNVPYKRVFVTIDLDAIVFNMESMKQNIKPGTEMMGVVKADGYGHGAVPVAKAMDPYVWGYAAATSEEALQLRAHGITKPVLVLSPVHPSEFQELIREGIRITVFTREQAEDISTEASALGKTANILQPWWRRSARWMESVWRVCSLILRRQMRKRRNPPENRWSGLLILQDY